MSPVALVPEGRAHALVALLGHYVAEKPSGHPEEGEGCEESPERRQSHRNTEIHRDSETCQLVQLPPLWVGRAEHPRLREIPGPRGAGKSARRGLLRRSLAAMGSVERLVAAPPRPFVERLVGPRSWRFVERLVEPFVEAVVIKLLLSRAECLGDGHSLLQGARSQFWVAILRDGGVARAGA